MRDGALAAPRVRAAMCILGATEDEDGAGGQRVFHSSREPGTGGSQGDGLGEGTGRAGERRLQTGPCTARGAEGPSSPAVHTAIAGRGSQRGDPWASKGSLGFLICEAEDGRSLRKAQTSNCKTGKRQHGEHS